MARYAKIDTRMWGDEKFRTLSRPQPSAQSLFIYLLTGPHNLGPGCFEAGEYGLAEKLRWRIDGFRAAFAELEAAGMVRADWDAQVVWIVNALAHDPPANANVVKHWGALLDTVPECDIRTTYLIELERYAERFGKRSAEPLAEPSRNRSPNGMPIPEPLTINQLPEPEPEPRHTTRARAHRSAREAATPAVADVVNAITHALAYDESAQLSGKEYARLVASAEEIVGAGGTPAEVPVRAERYARKYPSIAVTHGGLAGHWGELAVEPPARAPPSGSGPPVTFTRQIEANNAAASREFLALMEGTADGSPTVQRQHGSPRGGLPD